MQKISWQPSSSIEMLKVRAKLIKRIREFFAERKVLEVETPLLCSTSVTDPHIESIPAYFQTHPKNNLIEYYLQTSPEYAMKRLLAAGSGPIYHITKAFRQGEVGRLHNPEFSLLEWYRPGFCLHSLMREVDELLQHILQTESAEKKTYANVFLEFLNINPHTITSAELKIAAQKLDINLASEIDDKDTWLTLLFSECIEVNLGKIKPCFIYDFPASQAALARLNVEKPHLAERFEVYFKGMELANGFYELNNAHEQRDRFKKNNNERRVQGKKEMQLDEFFLAALAHGLPDCSGVALGLDRLIMLATSSADIKSVLSFSFDRV